MPVYRLSATQVRVLQLLASADGLTKKEIEARLGLADVDMGGSMQHGPSRDPNSLYNLGYVDPQREEGPDGRDVVRFYLTDLGREAARTHQVRVSETARIPPAVLDPVVIAFRPTRVYGLERYTEEDWEALRAGLPEEYHHTPLPALCSRVLARRKQGAYKEVKMLRCWLCGGVEEIQVVDTSSKKGVCLCLDCYERNEPYIT